MSVLHHNITVMLALFLGIATGSLVTWIRMR
jgi:hypothetical protein